MRVVFIGTGEIGVPSLRALLDSRAHELVAVVTQPDKPVGRDQQIRPPPIKAALTGSAMPVFQPPRIRGEEAVANLRALDAGGDRGHGVWPNPAEQRAGDSTPCLSQFACLAPAATPWSGANPSRVSRCESETGITVITWTKDSTLATSY
jgi:hypothetical protein